MNTILQFPRRRVEQVIDRSRPEKLRKFRKLTALVQVRSGLEIEREAATDLHNLDRTLWYKRKRIGSRSAGRPAAKTLDEPSVCGTDMAHHKIL